MDTKKLKEEFEKIGKKTFFDWSGDGQSEELWSFIQTAITKAREEGYANGRKMVCGPCQKCGDLWCNGCREYPDSCRCFPKILLTQKEKDK